MNPVIVGILVTLLFIAWLGPWIAGALIARGATRRRGWTETRVAYYGFALSLLVSAAAIFAFPLIGWLGNDRISSGLMLSLNLVFVTSSGLATVVIAAALYQLAKRAAVQGA